MTGRESRLFELFMGLASPARGRSGPMFAGALVSERASHRVAKDADGRAVLLIGTAGESTFEAPAIRLDMITVQHGVLCNVTTETGATEPHVYSVVSCQAVDDLHKRYFLAIGEVLLAALGDQPSPAALVNSIRVLVELFDALSQPPSTTVQGLWGELFVIANSVDPSSLVLAWHAANTERFDFAAGDERLEIKTTVRRERLHRFGLDQLRPVGGLHVIVGSILTEQVGVGTSIADLLERIRGRLRDRLDLALRVEAIAASTLGKGTVGGMERPYDAALAESTLTFYAASEIPAPKREALPVAISDVAFLVDMTAVPRLAVVPSGSRLARWTFRAS